MYALASFPQSSRGGSQERGPFDTHDTSDTQNAAVFYLANWEDAPYLTLDEFGYQPFRLWATQVSHGPPPATSLR